MDTNKKIKAKIKVEEVALNEFVVRVNGKRVVGCKTLYVADRYAEAIGNAFWAAGVTPETDDEPTGTEKS
jgi:hypothetical protein